MFNSNFIEPPLESLPWSKTEEMSAFSTVAWRRRDQVRRDSPTETHTKHVRGIRGMSR